MFSIRQIDSIDGLKPYKEKWDQTLEKSSTNIIFLTFDWITTWCKIYSEEGKPFVLLISDDEELIGIAPLTVVSSQIFGIRMKKIKFIGWNYLTYKDFIVSRKREECLNLIFSYLRDNSHLWDGIELFNIPKDSPNFNLVQKSCLTLDYLCHIEKGLSSPYIALNNDWNDYWKNRGKATRENTVIKIRRLKKRGVLHYGVCKDINTFNKVIPVFFTQHIKRWFRNGWISKYKKAKDRDFMLAIGKIFLNKRYLQFSFLELNDKVLATCYGFKYNDKVYYYSPTFNLEYAKYSPGRVLLYYMIENAFNENIREIDLLFGEDSYKLHWTREIRNNYQIQILQKKPLLRVLYYWLGEIKPKLREIKFLRKTKKILYNLRILMNRE